MNKRLYNVIFPVWFLILFPSAWLILLPANFVIDSLVLLLGLFILKIKDKKNVYKKAIFKIWTFGFIADILGSLIMFGIEMLPSSELTFAIISNPWSNIWALLVTVLAVIIAGILIFFLNKKFSFKNTDLSDKNKKIASLILAILTAPYFLLVPTTFIYNNYSNNYSKVIEKHVTNVSNEEIICALK